MLSMISFRCQIKPEPRPNCPLKGYFFSDEPPIHFYIGLFHPGGGGGGGGGGGKVYMILSSNKRKENLNRR